ncbi:MAG TPA: DUF4426 domain-containing protein [Xanthomonadaceae bacterium]|nr:DUF4426 domain-containing protein [Xanthomonadaceae bacterium]
MRPCLLIAFCVLGAGAAAQAPAPSNRIEAGDHVVYYNALPTTWLTPEVARRYGVRRSANRVLLNIAVHRRRDDGLTEAVTAEVTGTATNLVGQRSVLELREVREGAAVYYLAEIGFDGRETLRFDVQARAHGGPPVQVRFSQSFFPD